MGDAPVEMLVVDPDEAGALATAQALESGWPGSGCTVRRVGSAREAWESIRQREPSLTIVELNLPDMDGLTFCDRFRARSAAPLMVCTAASPRERILSLRVGADDVVAKPFDPDELRARAAALLRRYARTLRPRVAAGAIQVARVGGLMVDRVRGQATLGGRPLRLTPTEFRLLAEFADAPGDIIRRVALAGAAGGEEHVPESRALDMHVRRLRAKLIRAGPAAPRIVSVRGLGYRMVEGSEPVPADAKTAAATNGRGRQHGRALGGEGGGLRYAEAARAPGGRLRATNQGAKASHSQSPQPLASLAAAEGAHG